MRQIDNFDVIIVGGSFAGLSAGMALGRALRKVLIIDAGQPCNLQTPHSHNFLTQDGNRPSEIKAIAESQVLRYETVKFLKVYAVNAEKTEDGFKVLTHDKQEYVARKLIFASGVKDIMPAIPGFAACWGISVIHCPYCHGYEVRHQPTGILANGSVAFHYAQLISNWTKDLKIFTNGPSTLTDDENRLISKNNIQVIEKVIALFNHQSGHLQSVVFVDGSELGLSAIYSRPDFEQHSKIPELLGCKLTEQGLLQVDMLQQTSVEGLYACGDNTSPMRSVANAVAAGNLAGAAVNHSLVVEAFANGVA